MDMKQSPLQVKDGIVYFHVTESLLTQSGVEAISAEFKELSATGGAKVMIVDQLNLQHALSPEADKAWIELYRHLPEFVDKTATICQDIVNKLQINYVFQMEGVSDRFKAFVEEDSKEVCNFLGIQQFHL